MSQQKGVCPDLLDRREARILGYKPDGRKGIAEISGHPVVGGTMIVEEVATITVDP